MLKADSKLTTLFFILGLESLPEYSISIAVGYIIGVCVQIGLMWKKTIISIKNIVILIIFSMAVTYLVVTVFEHDKYIGVWVMMGSMMSVFLVSEGEKLLEAIIKNKFSEYAKRFTIKKEEDE